jgi:hypothetical protein
MKQNRNQVLIAVLLTLVAMSTRLLFNAVHFYNFNAVMATALFAGAYLSRNKLVVLIPIVALFVTDLAMGLYDWKLMAIVYGAFVLTIFYGRFYAENSTLLSFVVTVLGGSLSFFLLTNGAVWMFGDGTFYPKTFAGLIECYSMGLPFYRNTLLGDILFSGALFAGYQWLIAPKAEKQTIPTSRESLA